MPTPWRLITEETGRYDFSVERFAGSVLNAQNSTNIVYSNIFMFMDIELLGKLLLSKIFPVLLKCILSNPVIGRFYKMRVF